MANYASDVPLVNSPIADAKGNITEAWLLFLIQLWRRTGSGSGDVPPDVINASFGIEQSFAPVIFGQATDFANETLFSPVVSTSFDPGITFAPTSETNFTQAAHAVTLGSSPATYSATSKQGFHMTGGTVSALTLNRGPISLPIGNSASDIVDNTFSSGVDFTPGTTTALTLSKSFGAISRLWVYFDGVFQGDDQIASLVGTTITFTSAIPVGVSKVYVKGLLQSSVGIGSTLVELSPGDSVTVTYSSVPTVTILPR